MTAKDTKLSVDDVVAGLFAAVAKKEIPMAEASRRLRAFVGNMPAEDAEEFRKSARQKGMFMMSVAEGFLEELTLVSAT